MTQKFDNKGDEYQGYGHYLIDGEHFYSIKEFKSMHDLDNNFPKKNGEDGIMLDETEGIRRHPTKPEEGELDVVYVYAEQQLEDFYYEQLL